MKKTKFLGIMFLAGVILIIAGLSMGAKKTVYFDMQGIHAMDYSKEEETHIKEMDIAKFSNIDIDAGSYDVEILTSDSFGYEIRNYRKNDLIISIEKGTLKIEQEKGKFNILNFDFSFLSGVDYTNYIKVYIPADTALGDLFIKSSSGKINISDIICNKADIKNSSGNCNLSNSTYKDLKVKLTSGGANIKNLTSGTADIHLSSGNINANEINFKQLDVKITSGSFIANECEAEKINLKMSSGKTDITKLSSKGLDLTSTSGSVKIQGDLLGENNLKSSSGSINLILGSSEKDYYKEFKASSGSIYINGKKQDNFSGTNEKDAPNSLKINVTSGNININFNN